MFFNNLYYIESKIDEAGKTNWKGKLSKADLLIKVTCFACEKGKKSQFKKQLI